ncbi:MAG: ribosome assembly factor SBDS [archaeon]|nr:ribosome assembly factor SBDS [archaeon]MCR4324047.1 ribosome assembly factor SBDS [Nanoarchaeota archaeon]
MTQTTARIKRGSKNYEILVDLEEALKFRKDPERGNINTVVVTNAIFYNLKSGEHASQEDLESAFGTRDITEVAAKIIKSGEIERTVESIRADQNKRYKQVVEFLSRNAVSPEGRPYTPDRIMKALSEANVNVKNKPIEFQVGEILDQLSKILPIRIEKKKVKLTIPAIHTGKAYGIIKEFMTEEKWKENGNLEAIVEMPSGLIFDFYDRLNSATQGSVMSEELKK